MSLSLTFVVSCVCLIMMSRYSQLAHSYGYRSGLPYNNQKQPHIILILTDDQGWNDVGWHNKSVLTPNMNRLARDGVILKNSYVQPVCTPSRAAILSGKYPFRTGLQWLVIGLNQPKFLPRNIVTLPELLKKAGYSTHMTGKWHLGHCSNDLTPTERGFDSFVGLLRARQDYFKRTAGGGYDFWKNQDVFVPPEESYNTDLFTNRAVEVIENHNPNDAPLFLYIAHTTPHFPLQVPQRFKDLYPDVTDPDRQAYLGMVSSLDESVGKVVSALEKNNYRDTIIIFLSDNGGDLKLGASNYPLRGDKGDLWEGGTKSAGFVYSPTLLKRTGCEHHGMIHAVDWFPTILDMAKYPKRALPKDIDGVSQWKYLRSGSGSGRREFVYNIDDDISKTAAIRFGKYKMIVGDPRVFVGATVTRRPADPNNTDVRLFDLKRDPTETFDIAYKKPSTVRMMLNILEKYRQLRVPAQNPPGVPRNITQPNGIVTPGWC